MVNGANDLDSWTYDAMSRITAEQNPLGTYAFDYVDDTPGSSKGTLRLASIAYPNSQTTNFSYLPNIGDQRLQQISNLGPGSSPPTLAQFNYAYSQAGEITQWLQNVNGTTTHLSLGYDKASQLTVAPSDSGSTFNAYISGTPHAGDVVSVTAYDASLTGTTPPGQETASYTVQSGDTSATIASNLATNISSAMSNISVTASAASNAVVTINTSPSYATSFTVAVSGTGATDTIALSGSSATQPLHNQIYYHYDQAANRDSMQGNSTGSFPDGLTTNVTQSQYNCVNALTSAGPGGAVKFQGTTMNPIKSAVVNISQAATVGGTGITAGDVVIIGVHDKALSQAENVSYTVQSSDTFTSIAAALATKINTDTTLQGIGVSATATGSVVTISSSSTNATTYTTAVSNGATETLTLGGSLSKTAHLNWSESFSANPVLAVGSNTAAITAVSGGGTPATNTYPITVSSGTTQTFTNDANGNMTGDGTNNYSWDAENRVLTVTYPGSNNYSQFTYDGLGNRVKIVETRAGSVTSTKQFVYCGNRICEERDASGNVTRQFFSWGENIGGTNYYYFKDHNGTIWGMCDASGTIVALYTFDPYGVKTTIIETVAPTFQYAGMYFHGPSGLYLTKYRAYSPAIGRWLSRDPLEEVLAQINIPDITGTGMPVTLVGNINTTAAPSSLAALAVPGIVQSSASSSANLYEYALNNPVGFIDPLGLQNVPGTIEYVPTGIPFFNVPYYDSAGGSWAGDLEASPGLTSLATGMSAGAQAISFPPTWALNSVLPNLNSPTWNPLPNWTAMVLSIGGASWLGNWLRNWFNSMTPAARMCPLKR